MLLELERVVLQHRRAAIVSFWAACHFETLATALHPSAIARAGQAGEALGVSTRLLRKDVNRVGRASKGARLSGGSGRCAERGVK